jgi:hypothetical protein
LILVPHLDQLGLDSDGWAQVCDLANDRQVEHAMLIETQSKAALSGRWDVVYALSALAGLETSVLIDAEDNVSVDWGSPGRVALSPPVGCAAPFKVWTHTHPGFDAYWSGTDTNSLAIASGIVSRALVLGAPGIKQSLNEHLSTVKEGTERIMNQGPLNHWTNETILSWESFYEEVETTVASEVNA